MPAPVVAGVGRRPVRSRHSARKNLPEREWRSVGRKAAPSQPGAEKRRRDAANQAGSGLTRRQDESDRVHARKNRSATPRQPRRLFSVERHHAEIVAEPCFALRHHGIGRVSIAAANPVAAILLNFPNSPQSTIMISRLPLHAYMGMALDLDTMAIRAHPCRKYQLRRGRSFRIFRDPKATRGRLSSAGRAPHS